MHTHRPHHYRHPIILQSINLRLHSVLNALRDFYLYLKRKLTFVCWHLVAWLAAIPDYLCLCGCVYMCAFYLRLLVPDLLAFSPCAFVAFRVEFSPLRVWCSPLHHIHSYWQLITTFSFALLCRFWFMVCDFSWQALMMRASLCIWASMCIWQYCPRIIICMLISFMRF